MRNPAESFRRIWGDKPTWLEMPWLVRALKPLLSGKFLPKIPDSVKKSPVTGFLAKNMLDVGIISSASLFFGVWSLGLAPLTVFAGVSLAGVVALRAYQGLTKERDKTPETLNKKGALTRFFNRPAAAYTLSSLTGLGTSILASALAIMGIHGVSPIRFISMAIFSLVFSAANNMKAARLDRDRGYDVEALPGLRSLNPSWSEKLSVVGNIARTFMAGSVVGLLTLPLMRQALEFSDRDKNYEVKTGVSYTERSISPLYGWEKPHSDSGMSRRWTGIANIFSAAAAFVAGDPRVAVSLAYPAVAQFALGQQADEAYATRRLKQSRFQMNA